MTIMYQLCLFVRSRKKNTKKYSLTIIIVIFVYKEL